MEHRVCHASVPKAVDAPSSVCSHDNHVRLGGKTANDRGRLLDMDLGCDGNPRPGQARLDCLKIPLRVATIRLSIDRTQEVEMQQWLASKGLNDR